MTFHEEKLDDFFNLFSEVKAKIAQMPGCMALKAFTDVADKTVIITYSEWKSEEDLQHYRESLLFNETWTEVKKLFKAAPVAWSMNEWQS